ncbi:MAG: hypothetical protein QW578_08430, partial [Thermoplasmatales archaeon]
NEKEMAERMEYLAQNPDIVKKMGNAGREHVLKNFDDKVFVENLKKILEEHQSMFINKMITAKGDEKRFKK